MESKGKLKTCDTRGFNLFQKTEISRRDHCKHLSTGRAPSGRAPNGCAPPRRAPTQQSARRRVPGGPYSEGWINFPFSSSIPGCTLLFNWAQLGASELSLGISPLFIGSSPSQDCSPTCNNIIPSDTRLQGQYKEESLSATGSSKTLLQHLQAHSYSEATTTHYPYKTSIQDCFEHCLGTVLSHLKVFATILQFLLPGLLLLLGRALLPDYSHGYTQVFATILQFLLPGLLLLLGRALLPDYSHGYTQVFATILQFLLPGLLLLLGRALLPDYSHGYTQVFATILQFLLPGLLLLLGRALLPDYSHGYTQVFATILQFLLPGLLLLLGRALLPDYSHGYTQVFATILQFLLPGLLLLLGRALLPDYSHGYTQVFATILQFLLPGLLLLLGRALLPDYSHGYTQVFATILQFLHLWPTSPSWTRASFQTTHTDIHRCLLRSCSSYISGLLLLLGRAPPSRLLTRLYTGGCLTV